MLVRNHFASVDPGMRGRLSGEASYTAPEPLGDVVGSATVGRVISSLHQGFAEGDWVAGAFGWQELGLSPGGRGIRRIPQGPIPPSAHIGVLGIPGLTAYFGLLDIGEPKPGETVLVSTAAGAVGSAAGQIARIKGARAVGIAGGPAKCQWLIEELGFDAAIDRLAEPDIAAAVERVCPDGVDVFFDNVGNSLVDAILPLMRLHGRLVISGQTADYNLPREERVGLKNTRPFITARLKMQGLVVFDYAREFPRPRPNSPAGSRTAALKIPRRPSSTAWNRSPPPSSASSKAKTSAASWQGLGLERRLSALRGRPVRVLPALKRSRGRDARAPRRSLVLQPLFLRPADTPLIDMWMPWAMSASVSPAR